MIKQFRDKSVPELQKLLLEWKSQLLALRFQQAAGQLQQTHQFRTLRLSVARALTVLGEKQKETDSENAQKNSAAPEKKGKKPAAKKNSGGKSKSKSNINSESQFSKASDNTADSVKKETKKVLKKKEDSK